MSNGIIVHDWIEAAGGAERVLDSFAAVFPDERIFTLWSDAPDRFPAQRIGESWLAHTPLRHRKAIALPFMLPTWRNLKSSDASWILVSSHLFAHHAKLRGTQRDIPKLVYCHTPARYIWEPSLDKRGSGMLTRSIAALVKPIDRKRARDAASIAANSQFVQERIRRTWGVESRVIYPPVDTARLARSTPWRDELSSSEREQFTRLPESYLLGASRFVPYKRLEQVIAAGEATGQDVVLAGGGPDKPRLLDAARDANTNVMFIDAPSDQMLYALMEGASAFVFPGVEDFGIIPVEAMALGTPAIVNSTGGSSESIRITGGGESVTSFTADEWRRAFSAVKQLDRQEIRERTRISFSRQRFEREIKSWVDEVVGS